MKLNRTVTGVGIALVLCMSVAFAAVNGVFANVSASGFVHSLTEMTAPTFNGALNGNANTATALAATPAQCSGGTPLATGITANGTANCTAGPSRICNANGCYEQYPDGTIHAWGTITTASSGGTLSSGTITYPVTFTSIPNPIVNGNAQPDGTDDVYVTYTRGLSTTGATVVIRCGTNIGGSGCGSIAAVPVSWIANGN